MTETWVLLWSRSQCAFHLETVDDMLKANRAAFDGDRRMDYVPLVIGQRAECEKAADALRPVLVERQEQARA